MGHVNRKVQMFYSSCAVNKSLSYLLCPSSQVNDGHVCANMDARMNFHSGFIVTELGSAGFLVNSHS